MKSVIICLWLMSFAAFVACAPKYRHKSEDELAAMTPAQRVDEYADEQAYHKYDVLDEHSELIEKYIWRDGLAALPRMIEIMDEYDPTRAAGKRRHKGERFDAMWMLLSDLDNHVVRVRATEDGRRAMDALERAIKRMRAAGYGQPDQQDWARNGRFESAVARLERIKKLDNYIDDAIRDTFRVEYKIIMSDAELLEFSNFLVARDPTYPSWSEQDYIKDSTRLNAAGVPIQIHVMKKPERFHEAYLDFKRAKRS